MTAMSAALEGISIRQHPAVPDGLGWLVQSPSGPVWLVRHTSQALTRLAGATCHYSRSTCPTWTDAAECRCMLGSAHD